MSTSERDKDFAEVLKNVKKDVQVVDTL